MCGICGVYGSEDAASVVRETLLALQHRGQNGAGMAVPADDRFDIRKGGGLVREVDKELNFSSMHGFSALGHTRYPTFGGSDSKWLEINSQPEAVMEPCPVAMIHNGNVTNAHQLAPEIERRGIRFRRYKVGEEEAETRCDVKYLIGALAIALEGNKDPNDEDIFHATQRVMENVNGAYSAVALIKSGKETKMLAFTDPLRIRPCVAGTRDGMHMVASETTALADAGFEYQFDLGPGEAVIFSKHGMERRQLLARGFRPCMFEYVYFAAAESVIDGTPVAQIRYELGKKLAEREERKLDAAVYIPDSGKIHAEGFVDGLWEMKGWRVPLLTGFSRRRYVQRTFIEADREKIPTMVRKKLEPIRYFLDGKELWLDDDSTVRGNTGRGYVAQARQAGARKVHVRCSTMPTHPCPYGIDFHASDELLYNQIKVRVGNLDHEAMEQEIAKAIGADSFHFNPPNVVAEIIRKFTGHEPDIACLDGKYPTEDGYRLLQIGGAGRRSYEVGT